MATPTIPLTVRPVVRVILVTLAFVAWIAAFGLVYGSGDVTTAGAVAFLVLCGGFGFIVNRWWVFLLPAFTFGVPMFVRYLTDPSCADTCGHDDTWTSLVILLAILVVFPMTVAMLLGVAAARARDIRRIRAGEQIAPKAR